MAMKSSYSDLYGPKSLPAMRKAKKKMKKGKRAKKK